MPLTDSERRALADGAAALGVELSEDAVARLERYVDELRRWMPRTNLVSQADAPVLVTRHLLDSLAAVPLLADTPPDAVIADVGSGAGLPGIPLAVALAPRRLVLVEPRRKRASFLRAAARAVQPAAVEVREGRIEEVAGAADLRGRLAAAVTRAALASDAFLAAVRPLLAEGGSAIAYRSSADACGEHAWPGFAPPERHVYRVAPADREGVLVRWRRSTQADPGGRDS